MPVGLQHKVWFDLCFQLCQRGRENMRNMTKSMFSVSTDGNRRSSVFQVGEEQDKNHGPTDNPHDTTGERRLYEVPDHPLCPVSTFQDYIFELDSEIPLLWQRPKEKVSVHSSVWYGKARMDEKSLGNLMPTKYNV